MRAWLTLAGMVAMSALATAQDLDLRREGKSLGRWPLARLKAEFSSQTLVLDGGQRKYWVLPLRPLLEKVYKRVPSEADSTFVFVCKDGYRAPVPAAEILKYPAFLAYACSDGKDFRWEGKDLGPFYLVWDVQRFPQREKEASWPYQVVAIEQTSFSRAYSKVTLPATATAQEKRGLALFRKHCLSCHSINGQGGHLGVDLNSPVSVTEYIQPAYLSRIIDNPRSVRHGAVMPGLDPKLAQRPQAIADLIAFLKAKARQPSAPPKTGK